MSEETTPRPGSLSYPKRPADALRSLQDLEDAPPPARATPAPPPEEVKPAPQLKQKAAAPAKGRNVTTSQSYNVTNESDGFVEGVARVVALSRDAEMKAHLNSRLTQEADELIEEALYALRHIKAKKQAVVSAALEIGLREILKETHSPPQEGA